MTQIAAVIPVCQEEVKCARTAAISACSPATQTFANAIERAMTSANGSSSCASSLRAGDPMRGVGGKKGLIPVQAKAILQDTYLLACMQTHTYSTGEKAPEPESNLMEACTTHTHTHTHTHKHKHTHTCIHAYIYTAPGRRRQSPNEI